MTEYDDPEDERYAYSRAALARLVLATDAQEMSVLAETVALPREHEDPREILELATRLNRLAGDVLRAAVISARERGLGWEAVIAELDGDGEQAVHEGFVEDMKEWREALLDPVGPVADPGRPAALRLHDAAYQPWLHGRVLDEWAVRRGADPAGTGHPVTGALPTLSTVEETAVVLDGIRHAQETGAGPEVRARLLERKASLLDRIAVEEGRQDAAEQADEDRFRAARLRREGGSAHEPCEGAGG